MKKHILVFTMLLFSLMGKAQDYYHGLGAQVNYGIFRTNDFIEIAAVPGIVYKATFGFDINRNMAFAVSAYPFVGLTGSLNSQSGVSSGASIGAELPILGELYFGEIDYSCFIIGGGFSAAFLGTSGYGSGAIVGPQLALGGQFPIQDRLLGLRLSYTYGVNGGSLTNYSKRSMINGGIYYVLGQ